MDYCEDTDYTCTICLDILFLPVTLPCKHRLCKHCFQLHIQNNGFICHMCRHRLSNWLRQVKRKTANIVDENLWKKIQIKYPNEIEARKHDSVDAVWNPIASESGKILDDRIEMVLDEELIKDTKRVHEVATSNILKHCDEWHGWDSKDTTCRDIVKRVLSQLEPLKQESSSQTSGANHIFARPGELREEFEKFIMDEREKRERENLRLSTALIEMILADEEEEQKKKEEQLRKDEELARRLFEEQDQAFLNQSSVELPNNFFEINGNASDLATSLLSNTKDAHNAEPNSSLISQITDVSNEDHWTHRSPGENINEQNNNSKNTEDLSETSSNGFKCSTPLRGVSLCSRASLSPIDFAVASTSKDDPFLKWKLSDANLKDPNDSIETVLNLAVLPAGPAPTNLCLTNEGFSNFAKVPAHSLNSSTGSERVLTSSGEETVSRCSSGADSIGQEMHHFKPIRTSPTTPPKDKSSSLIPHLVVAHKPGTLPAMGFVDNKLLKPNFLTHKDTASIDRAKQEEEDARLARQLFEEELKKNAPQTTPKPNYNLRKRKRTNSLRKKVLVDQAQTTLDHMFVK